MGYAPSTIPQIDVKIAILLYKARPRKLRGLYSFRCRLDLKLKDIKDRTAAAQLA